MVGNAPQIFPGLNRSVANPGNYQILVNEVRKVSHDVEQAGKIAESIETANEDIFRDFDLSTFMEHFKMDALEKTILALAFKTCSRADLKTKGKIFTSTWNVRLTSHQRMQYYLRITPPFSKYFLDLMLIFTATSLLHL